MNQVLRSVVQTVCLLCGLLALHAFSAEPAPASAETPRTGGAETNEAAAVGAVDDVIARVGGQEITFSELNTMLNSSAVVGVSIPALGTPERDTVRITLLDKVVSANLIYLDALQQDLDQDPAYRQKLDRFTDGILMALYRDRLLSEDIQVSEAEIQAHYEANIQPGTELTGELRSVIEAAIRRDKIREQQGTLRARLREGVTIELNESAFDPLQDAERADSAVLATVDGVELRWGEAKDKLGQAISSTSVEERRQAVNALIDRRILLAKARAAGLEQDPAFIRRFNEYHKTRLINLHRENLARDFEPSDEELRAYYKANRDNIMEPEFRKVQMVVLKTEAEAEAMKTAIEEGDMTMFQVAREHSIDPGAKQNLGEIGWVNRGKAVPALDAAIFALGPGEIGGPVQTPAGWHLVMVQDVREAKYDDLVDRATRNRTRRSYIHDKLADYVVELRKNRFPVEVYEDKLIALAQQEADMVKELTAKAAEPGSVTQQRIEEMQEIFNK